MLWRAGHTSAGGHVAGVRGGKRGGVRGDLAVAAPAVHHQPVHHRAGGRRLAVRRAGGAGAPRTPPRGELATRGGPLQGHALPAVLLPRRHQLPDGDHYH